MSRLNKIVSEVLGVTEAALGQDAKMTNLANWNSLSHIELILAIEEGYDI